ncbi:DUF6274 family protein [Streptomyces sp. NPDC048590]|uniref:DUF6274 family protein n=1 Tax=Streptomyces sp. NPDC048590 TaxID=3365574 RepID=UPI00372100A8
MSAPAERHETRALLRAHLAAASGYRHLTRHCPICHRLLRLALEPLTDPQAPPDASGPGDATEAPRALQEATGVPGRCLTEDPPPARLPTNRPVAEGGPESRSPGDESPPTT